MIKPDIKCPLCQEPLYEIEVVSSDKEQTKVAYECNHCNIVVYIVYFREEDR